jgi:uridine monophosphate synthetase
MKPKQLFSTSSLENNLKEDALRARSLQAAHPLAQALLKIMAEKRTNLALACDVLSQKDLLKWADAIGPHICVLKTHIDILQDFTPSFPTALRKLAEKHKFLIFEDRKFADIGQTTSMQYAQGIYRIAEWADLINAHIIPGPGIIEALKQVGKPKGRGLLLLAEMSSSGTLAKGAYTKKALEWGEAHADFVCGFIALRKLSDQPGMIHFTPGVKFAKGIDFLGQKYRTAEQILSRNKSDVIIVGRDITQAPDPIRTAAAYQEIGWNA